MESLIFDRMASYDYENLFFCQEKTLGLRAIIAIHVIAISKEQGIPTHRAANILAEERIASVGQAKRLAISGQMRLL